MVLILGATFVVGGRIVLENFGAGVALQARTPFHPRDEIGILDHELDIVVEIDGTRRFKDLDELETSVTSGRFRVSVSVPIRAHTPDRKPSKRSS